MMPDARWCRLQLACDPSDRPAPEELPSVNRKSCAQTVVTAWKWNHVNMCVCVYVYMSLRVRTRQFTIEGRQAKTACLATATWCWMKVVALARHRTETGTGVLWFTRATRAPAACLSTHASETKAHLSRKFPKTRRIQYRCSRIWKDWNYCMCVYLQSYHKSSSCFVVCRKLRQPSCCVFICPGDSRPQPWFASSLVPLSIRP